MNRQTGLTIVEMLGSRWVQYPLAMMFLATLVHKGMASWAALAIVVLNVMLLDIMLGFFRAWLEDDDDDDDDGLHQHVPADRGVA